MWALCLIRRKFWAKARRLASKGSQKSSSHLETRRLHCSDRCQHNKDVVLHFLRVGFHEGRIEYIPEYALQTCCNVAVRRCVSNTDWHLHIGTRWSFRQLQQPICDSWFRSISSQRSDVLWSVRGIQIWATGRFPRFDDYIFKSKRYLHSERFLRAAILPEIRAQSISVDEDPSICFWRARADQSVDGSIVAGWVWRPCSRAFWNGVVAYWPANLSDNAEQSPVLKSQYLVVLVR
jgi:hypothetical protein